MHLYKCLCHDESWTWCDVDVADGAAVDMEHVDCTACLTAAALFGIEATARLNQFNAVIDGRGVQAEIVTTTPGRNGTAKL